MKSHIETIADKLLQEVMATNAQVKQRISELESERDYYKAEAERHNAAANDAVKRCAHWIEKHDALLESQLKSKSEEWTDENVITWCFARGVNAAAMMPASLVGVPKDNNDCKNCEFHYKDIDAKPCNTCVRNRDFISDNWMPL